MEKSCQRPVLTVSIAAYNVEEYLAGALDSCLVADDGRLEVIVVDDGSKDSTLQIANKYADAHPNTFKVIAKENGGYGSTLNASLSVARGKYFRFLDGDDWFDTEALGRYLDILDGVDCDVAFTAYNRVYDASGDVEFCNCLASTNEGIYQCRELMFRCDVAAHAATFRTSLLKDNHITITEHCFYTDVEYVLLPLMYAETAHVCHLPVYQYRIGREGQSVSVAGIRAHWRDHLRVTERLLGEFEGRQDLLHAWPQLNERLAGTISYDYFILCCVGDTHETRAELEALDDRVRVYQNTYDLVLRKSWRARLINRLTLHAFPICAMVTKATLALRGRR